MKLGAQLGAEHSGKKVGAETTRLRLVELPSLRSYPSLATAEEERLMFAELSQGCATNSSPPISSTDSTVPVDLTAPAEACRRHWQELCKPLHSLGRLESLVVKLALQQHTASPQISPRALFIFAADHGIVAEGVSQAGQEVTAQVLLNMAQGQSTAHIFARATATEVYLFDLGVAQLEQEHKGIYQRKINPRGSHNFLHEAALSKKELYQAIFLGYDLAQAAAAQGYRLLIAGEMGIGNTSAATAILAALHQVDPVLITGRGAGLSDQALARKTAVLQAALAARPCLAADPLAILEHFGGLEIAAMTGFYLAAAQAGCSILLDGLISLAAANVAVRLQAQSKANFILPCSAREPAAELARAELGLKPYLQLDFALGEGAGALTLIPLLDLGLRELNELPSFSQGQVAAYTDYTACSGTPGGESES